MVSTFIAVHVFVYSLPMAYKVASYGCFWKIGLEKCWCSSEFDRTTNHEDMTQISVLWTMLPSYQYGSLVMRFIALYLNFPLSLQHESSNLRLSKVHTNWVEDCAYFDIWVTRVLAFFFFVIIFIVGKIAVFEPDSVRVVLFWTFAGLTESHWVRFAFTNENLWLHRVWKYVLIQNFHLLTCCWLEIRPFILLNPTY